jgi:hypothetical protein
VIQCGTRMCVGKHAVMRAVREEYEVHSVKEVVVANVARYGNTGHNIALDMAMMHSHENEGVPHHSNYSSFQDPRRLPLCRTITNLGCAACFGKCTKVSTPTAVLARKAVIPRYVFHSKLYICDLSLAHTGETI